MKSKLKFSVDSALLKELGEKLVQSVHLAIAELVKNAYDADASEVKIIFKVEESEIHIVDDGVGMNFETVQNYWMRIATTNKLDNNFSPKFGRPKTGAKGIGRFSCRRLGPHLRLITVGLNDSTNNNNSLIFEKTVVDFPWDDFEPGSEVSSIECEGTQTKLDNANTGTSLIIKNAKFNELNKRGFGWLKRELTVLAANTGAKREGFQVDKGFNIVFDIPGDSGVRINLREKLIDAGWGTIKGRINSEGLSYFKLQSLLSKTVKTIHPKKKFSNLKDISFEIGILIDNREEMRDKSVISKGTLQEILPDWGGVQVRYKGFRVFPYGDDDWLGIDRDRGLRRGRPQGELLDFANTLKGVDPKRALLTTLSMRSYVGHVEIGELAEGFEMKADRTGFLESKEFSELIEFVRFGIHWAEIYRNYYLGLKNKKESDEAKNKLEEILQESISNTEALNRSVNLIQKELKYASRHLNPKERTEIRTRISTATNIIQNYHEKTQNELFQLRLAFSTSNLVIVFSHEVKSLLGLLDLGKASMENILKKIDNDKLFGSLNELKDKFLESKNRFKELLDMTSIVGAHSKDSTPGQIAIRERIIKSIDIYRLIIGKYDIDIDIQKVKTRHVFKEMLEGELYSILLNILSNAIKALLAVSRNRRIQFETFSKEGKTVLIIRDNGIGLDPKYFEDVFITFISDPANNLYRRISRKMNPEDSYILGSGSGFGLGIVKQIVEFREGKIKFVPADEGWKTQLEISLP
jgi:signal transduction histidine kinase